MIHKLFGLRVDLSLEGVKMIMTELLLLIAPPLTFLRTGQSRGGWMVDLRFYVFFNSISVLSGRWAGDKERLKSFGSSVG